MENEQLLQVLAYYKQALADCTENKFVYMAIANRQAKEIQELKQELERIQRVDEENIEE